MDEHRGHGGIDAAGETTDDAPIANLSADFFHGLLLEGAHCPIAAATGDLADEIAEQGGAVRGMHNLQMELRGVEAARLISDHGNWRVGRGGDHTKPFG